MCQEHASSFPTLRLTSDIFPVDPVSAPLAQLACLTVYRIMYLLLRGLQSESRIGLALPSLSDSVLSVPGPLPHAFPSTFPLVYPVVLPMNSTGGLTTLLSGKDLQYHSHALTDVHSLSMTFITDKYP